MRHRVISRSRSVRVGASDEGEYLIHAIFVLPSAVLNYRRKRLVELTARERLPATYPAKEVVEEGARLDDSAVGADPGG